MFRRVPHKGRTRGTQKSVLNWLNTSTPEGRHDLVVSPVGPGYELAKDKLHQFIEAAGQDSDRLEQDRLLYVACTRAKRSLNLVCSVELDGEELTCKPPSRGSLLSRLWPVVAPAVEASLADQEPAADANIVDVDDTVLVQPVLRRKKLDWRVPDPQPLPGPQDKTAVGAMDEPSEIQFDWVGSIARDAGTIVHRWLQRFATTSLPGVSAGVDSSLTAFWAAECGVSKRDLPEVQSRVNTALEAMLGDEKGRWLLDGDGHCELPLTGLWQGRIVSVVIDRVRIDADTHWIIDYKTGTHEGGELASFVDNEVRRYTQQLARYRELYRAHSGAQDIRCALYFPQLKEFREVRLAN